MFANVEGTKLTLSEVANRRASLSKGICYTPYPSKATEDHATADGATFSQDDWMAECAKPLWGPRGRDDLRTMKALGANTVRLYGNNMLNDHGPFLDYAHELGLKVIVGISNYPYNQMVGNCQSIGGDCFQVIKTSYRENLRRGFATREGSYHPAIDHVIVINEPDIQLTYEPEVAVSWRNPKFWALGALSAIDGVLEAEKEMGLTGLERVFFTATMTFANCHLCFGQDKNSTKVAGEIYPSKTKPSLGQMMELRNALLHPSLYNYTPRNNLTEFFTSRLLNSLNTKNPWIGVADRSLPDVRCTDSKDEQGCRKQSVKTLFFDFYEAEFPNTPLYFEEYHSFWQWGYENTRADLDEILDAAASSTSIRGLNFFEFQISYGKTEVAKHPDALFEELLFGIFGLGNYSILDMEFFGTWTSVQCLTEIAFDPLLHRTDGGAGAFRASNAIVRAITGSYGGRGIDSTALCRPDPEKVPLTALGFAQVKALPNEACEPGMAIFVKRLVSHFGGMATVNKGTRAFARKICSTSGARAVGNGDKSAPALADAVGRHVPSKASAGDERQFTNVVRFLERRPNWAWWSEEAACVADRSSDSFAVSRSVDSICRQGMMFFQCHRVPESCRRNEWLLGDYVLSVYFDELQSRKATTNPIKDCYFDGSAMYMSLTAQFNEEVDSSCVVSRDPASTPLTDEGFAAIRRSGSLRKSVELIERVIAEIVNGTACDQDELEAFADDPPSSMFELVRDLHEFWWICGGSTRRVCPVDGKICNAPERWKLIRSFAFQVVLCCLVVALVCTWAGTCIYAKNLPKESEDWLQKHRRTPRTVLTEPAAAATCPRAKAAIAPHRGAFAAPEPAWWSRQVQERQQQQQQQQQWQQRWQQQQQHGRTLKQPMVAPL